MDTIFNIINQESGDPIRKSAVSLIGRGDNTEVIKYEIPEQSLFVINPAEHSKAYEFYYVVKGELIRDETVIKANGCIEVLNLQNSISFRASVDTIILLFVSRTGEFDISSDFNRHFVEQMEAIELKDNYTYQHCRRVKRLVYKMGIALGMSDDKLQDLVVAANFHDIGKIRVHDLILNKCEKLNKDEYKLMREHVEHSAEILNGKVSRSVRDILIMHHERLDGSGYPKGLKGDKINLSGRILAVADTFDAMTTDRVYKPGKIIEDAIEELFSLSEQYDEEIVKILKELVLTSK